MDFLRRKNKLIKIQNFLLIIVFSGAVFSQEIYPPDQTISPFSSPEDCRVIQWNAGVISKRVIKIYEEIDEDVMSDNVDDQRKLSIDIKLDRAKKLSDISISLSKTYETFCKK